MKRNNRIMMENGKIISSMGLGSEDTGDSKTVYIGHENPNSLGRQQTLEIFPRQYFCISNARHAVVKADTLIIHVCNMSRVYLTPDAEPHSA